MDYRAICPPAIIGPIIVLAIFDIAFFAYLRPPIYVEASR